MAGIVRLWTDKDLPEVREVLRRTWEVSYAAFIPTEDLRAYLDQVYSLEGLRRLSSDPDVTGFVGVQDERVVATMRMKIERTESRCYVSSIYVVPEAQGQGWGRRLMRLAAERSVAFGRTELWLGVMSQNLPALAWYKKNGFVAVREEPFTMGRTTIAHLIGCLPVSSFLAPAAEVQRSDPPKGAAS